MKKLTMIIAFLTTVCFYVQAQRGPLRGTGKLITKTLDFRDFDKLSFDDLDGKIDDTTKIYSMAGSEEQNPKLSTQELVNLIMLNI